MESGVSPSRLTTTVRLPRRCCWCELGRLSIPGGRRSCLESGALVPRPGLPRPDLDRSGPRLLTAPVPILSLLGFIHRSHQKRGSHPTAPVTLLPGRCPSQGSSCWCRGRDVALRVGVWMPWVLVSVVGHQYLLRIDAPSGIISSCVSYCVPSWYNSALAPRLVIRRDSDSAPICDRNGVLNAGVWYASAPPTEHRLQRLDLTDEAALADSQDVRPCSP